VVGLVLLVAGAAAAQEKPSEGFALDKLEIASLGAAIGRILPSQVEPTTLYAVQADYGDIAPGWHIVFGTSYWESRFRDAVVQDFVDSLKKSLVDPTGRATIAASRVTLYDVTFGTELRYSPVYSGEIKPFIGAGLAAHVFGDGTGALFAIGAGDETVRLPARVPGVLTGFGLGPDGELWALTLDKGAFLLVPG